MKKFAFLLVFFLFAFASASAEEYCKIDGDPVEKFKPLSAGENLYILPEDTLVDIKGKTENYHCVLEKGTVLVIKDGIAVRAYQCGNELITRLAVGQPEPESTPQVNNYYIIVPQQTQAMVPYYYRGESYGYNYSPLSYVYVVYDNRYSYGYPLVIYHRHYRDRDRRDHRHYYPRHRHPTRHPVRHHPQRHHTAPRPSPHPAPPHIP